MDFSISPKMQEILAQVREFVEKELYPLEPEASAASRPWCRNCRETGQGPQARPVVPANSKEYGGMGLTLLEHGMVSEALGGSTMGHYSFNCQAPDAGNMEILLQFGTDEQKKTWLRPLLEGEIRSCFSMTEPERPGSNPVWMDTTAVKQGTDYVINGRKWFTSSYHGAAFAIVMAVTNPEAPPHKRASQIIVPVNNPGFKFIRNIELMGHAGDDYDSHAEVVYERCRVPQSNVLGGEGEGFAIAQERLGPGRIHHCMRWIGICERSFDLMCKRAASRELSPGKPLGTQQIIQQWIADSRAEINAARLMVLQAAWKIDHQGMAEAQRRNLVHQILRRRRAVEGHRSGDPGPRRWGSPATRRWRRSCATNAGPASTTAPTKCTKWWSPNACWAATD